MVTGQIINFDKFWNMKPKVLFSQQGNEANIFHEFVP